MGKYLILIIIILAIIIIALGVVAYKNYIKPAVTPLTDAQTRHIFRADNVIVNLGDSIFGNNDSDTGVSNLISEYTGATVYNCAFGGTRMVRRKSRDTGYDLFDFSFLVDSIVSGDYKEQEKALLKHILPVYYKPRIDRLKDTDFKTVDIVTINYGTNDFMGGGAHIESFKQTALESISKFQTAFPNVKVVLITPTWRCWLNEDGTMKYDSNERENNGKTLVDFCKADEEIAKELNISFIDVYNIGINKHNWKYYFNGSDTTHQDINGRKRVADVIARGLLAM